MNASPYGFSKITLIICALLLFIITFLTYLPSLRTSPPTGRVSGVDSRAKGSPRCVLHIIT